MTTKKIIVALALLISATSASLAKTRSYYDFAGSQSAGGSTVFEDPQHGAGAASQR